MPSTLCVILQVMTTGCSFSLSTKDLSNMTRARTNYWSVSPLSQGLQVNAGDKRKLGQDVEEQPIYHQGPGLQKQLELQSSCPHSGYVYTRAMPGNYQYYRMLIEEKFHV